MDAPVLQRRPLPIHCDNGEHKEKSPYRQRKSVKALRAKGQLVGDESKLIDEDKVYYYILNGPSLFPWRRPPRNLPKIRRKCGNDTKCNTAIDKTLIIPSFNEEINNNCYFFDINGPNLKSPFGDGRSENLGVPQLHHQNLNDNDVIPEFERIKPWRLQLLEQQQQNQQYEHDVYNDTKPETTANGFIVQRSNYLEENKVDVKRKCDRHVVFNEIELRELPQVDNSEDNKCVFRDTAKLDVKGLFMDTLFPAISQTLCMCLSSVDLSYNDFKVIPEQLFFLSNIESLNMRNNPLKSVPKGIKQIDKLKYLNLSYCLLAKVSKNLCTLHDLEVLDVSYNLVSSIHEDIHKLVSLNELIIEGNRISIFPQSILKLNLKSLHLKFNFTHKVFWMETCPPVPQKLFDISTMTLLKNNLYHTVPEHLQSNTSCQCANCAGVMVGEGIVVLKPVAEVFGVEDVPLLFRVCSQTCRVELQQTEETPGPI